MGQLAKLNRRVLPEFVIDRSAPFSHHDNRVRRYILAKHQASAGLQAHFSWIVMENLWQEEMCWWDPETGERFDSEGEIPPERKLTVSLRPKYLTQEDWIKSLEAEAPSFARSTAFYRHSCIVRQMKELGRTFEEALHSVMLSPALYGVIARNVRGEEGEFDEEKVGRLVSKTKEARDQPTPKEKVIKYMELKEEEIQAGVLPRDVTRDVRTQVFGEHTMVFRWAQENPKALLAIYHETPDKREHTYYLAACTEDGEPTTLPEVVMEWIDRRLRLTAK